MTPDLIVSARDMAETVKSLCATVEEVACTPDLSYETAQKVFDRIDTMYEQMEAHIASLEDQGADEDYVDLMRSLFDIIVATHDMAGDRMLAVSAEQNDP